MRRWIRVFSGRFHQKRERNGPPLGRRFVDNLLRGAGEQLLVAAGRQHVVIGNDIECLAALGELDADRGQIEPREFIGGQRCFTGSRSGTGIGQDIPDPVP